VRVDTKISVVLSGVAVSAMATIAIAQHTGHGAAPSSPTAATGKPSAPVSMEELHRHGGVPRGWKFTLPAGDPKAGREVFGKLECNKCHEVKPDFPRAERGAGDVGPELTGMGGHHPAEYFAQSIVDPNAVIVAGAGFVGVDGRSVMPDYRDSLTFTELVDLVAYLKSLHGDAHAHHHGASPVREQTAGPYRLRVTYHAHARHGHAPQPGAAARPAGHLMAFVTDTATGEPVPYLPISVVITARTVAPRTVRLVPMVGGDGFHYGADVTIPQGTTKLTLNVGAAGLKTIGAAAGRFGKPVTVSFDWSE
jgi:mono/diheme cytochrome c family protein